MASSLKNNFLIAMPSLNDPFFYHSVVYLCEHSDQGAMGLIINRPTQLLLGELLDQVHLHTNLPLATNTPILFGGPVEKNQGMVLHDQPKGGWANSIAIADDVFLTSSTDILKSISSDEGPDHILVALGYASWQPGQLEQEISKNSWLNVEADNTILFNTSGKECWQQAASLLGVDINLLSNTIGHA